MAANPEFEQHKTVITGYGQFCVDLEGHLPKETVVKLANVFEFPSAEIATLKSYSYPAPAFIQFTKDKGILREDNITQLTEALERNSLSGVAKEVRMSFGKNVRASLDTTDHKNYPYVSIADFEKYKDQPGSLNDLNEKNADDYKVLFRNYSLTSNDSPVDPTGTPPEYVPHLRVALIGRTGCGKSATANSLLGRNVFCEGDTTVSETASSGIATSDIGNGRRVSVVDCPGLKDTGRTDQQVMNELARLAYLLREGVHAFIFVWNASDTRFLNDDRDTLAVLKRFFQNDYIDHVLVVYSHAESKLKKMSLNDFIERQKKHEAMRDFLDEIGCRVVAVNNNTDIPAEQQRNQQAVVCMIDKIVNHNGGKVYTNEEFREAQSLYRKVLDNCSDYHPAIVTAVVELYNSTGAKYSDPGELYRQVFRLLEKSRTGTVPLGLEGQFVSLINGTEEQILPYDECQEQIESIRASLDRPIADLLMRIIAGFGPALGPVLPGLFGYVEGDRLVFRRSGWPSLYYDIQ